MCGAGQCQHVPVSSLTITVEFCHVDKRWSAATVGRTIAEEGEIISHGSTSVEFGPFDSSTEVGYWLAAQVRQLRTFPAFALRMDSDQAEQ